MIEARTVEDVAAGIIAMADEGTERFEGCVMDRAWFREILDRAVDAPVEELCRIMAQVLIEEHGIAHSDARELAGRVQVVLSELARRLSH